MPLKPTYEELNQRIRSLKNEIKSINNALEQRIKEQSAITALTHNVTLSLSLKRVITTAY